MEVSEAASLAAGSTTSALVHPGYRLYWGARFLMILALQIVSVAVGWQLYDLTRDPFLLGLVGLVQFLPSLALVLVTGAVADRYNRRRIMGLCIAVEGLATLLLLALFHAASPAVGWVFAVLALLGTARAFMGPAVQSLVANLVPKDALPNAIALNTTSFHLATILGPVAGGLLYGLGSEVAYVTAVVLFAIAGTATIFIPKPAKKSVPEPPSKDTLLAGFRYIWSQPVILGAMSLDLVAVLLGGATALLPVFARDILDAGPWGLGMLRAATGAGALLMSLWLLRSPIGRQAGRMMVGAVSVYGLAIVAFGASSLVWLSVIALAVLGAADMVSVFIRQTLIQLKTPDQVRGRVSAVNLTFIGASNELGEFRAGSMAALIGAVPAVILGGAGAILASLVWLRIFPELRAVDRLDRVT
ncbi:MAG: MFS transporter [Hyphomicrobium sp.]